MHSHAGAWERVVKWKMKNNSFTGFSSHFHICCAVRAHEGLSRKKAGHNPAEKLHYSITGNNLEQGFKMLGFVQPFLSSSAISVSSQVNPSSFLPKCP